MLCYVFVLFFVVLCDLSYGASISSLFIFYCSFGIFSNVYLLVIISLSKFTGEKTHVFWLKVMNQRTEWIILNWGLWVSVMVINATLDNSSAISWRSGFLWRKPDIRRKPPTYHTPLTNFITKCFIEYTSPWARFKLTTLVLIGTDCIGVNPTTIPSPPRRPLDTINK